LARASTSRLQIVCASAFSLHHLAESRELCVQRRDHGVTLDLQPFDDLLKPGVRGGDLLFDQTHTLLQVAPDVAHDYSPLTCCGL